MNYFTILLLYFTIRYYKMSEKAKNVSNNEKTHIDDEEECEFINKTLYYIIDISMLYSNISKPASSTTPKKFE